MKLTTFRLYGETKGAVRYQEVDEEGKDVEGDDAFVGTLYFRKANFGQVSPSWASEGRPAKRVRLTIEEVE